MDFLLIYVGLVFIILGIIGSFLPVLPGPITGWIGLLILHQTSIELDGNLFLFVTLVISILVFLIDYIIPALGAKKFGGTTLYGPVAALKNWFNSDLSLENKSAKSDNKLKVVK